MEQTRGLPEQARLIAKQGGPNRDRALLEPHTVQ